MKKILLIVLVFPAMCLSQPGTIDPNLNSAPQLKLDLKTDLKTVNPHSDPKLKSAGIQKSPNPVPGSFADASSLLSHPVQKSQSSDSEYFFNNIPVPIENGHGDTIKVLFWGSITKKLWAALLEKNDYDETKAFYYLGQGLSLKAQYILKNPLSFEPFKKQKFVSHGGNVLCMYEMMGKNGYGNSVETTTIVDYNPLK